MSKYQKLWNYIIDSDSDKLLLSFDEIEDIIGMAIDHSFLTYKKELVEYGYWVSKISMKNKNICFEKIDK
ncbi:MAG: hypothetical protein ACI4MI_00440 [Christensenellales bacterium]